MPFLCVMPPGFCRLALACPSTDRGANSRNLGTSFSGRAGPYCEKNSAVDASNSRTACSQVDRFHGEDDVVGRRSSNDAVRSAALSIAAVA
jgi:hypothetical protein